MTVLYPNTSSECRDDTIKQNTGGRVAADRCEPIIRSSNTGTVSSSR